MCLLDTLILDIHLLQTQVLDLEIRKIQLLVEPQTFAWCSVSQLHSVFLRWLLLVFSTADCEDHPRGTVEDHRSHSRLILSPCVTYAVATIGSASFRV